MSVNYSELLHIVKEWVEEAGEAIRVSMDKPLNIETKSNVNDLVTEMDYQTEAFFKEKIAAHYPDHEMLGEEGTGESLHSTKGVLWIIDPIDGTTNFVHQQYNFAISIGIFEDGVGQLGLVYDVMKREWFTALKGEGAFQNEKKLDARKPVTLEKAIVGLNSRWLVWEHKNGGGLLHDLVQKSRSARSYGSAALELCYVACGRLDTYINLRLSPWDYAGSLIILDEVGASATTFSNEKPSLLNKGSFIASAPVLHEELLAYMPEIK